MFSSKFDGLIGYTKLIIHNNSAHGQLSCYDYTMLIDKNETRNTSSAKGVFQVNQADSGQQERCQILRGNDLYLCDRVVDIAYIKFGKNWGGQRLISGANICGDSILKLEC